jgi:hypothetical protein
MWKQLHQENGMKRAGGMSKADFFEIMNRVNGHKPTFIGKANKK